MVAQAKRAPDIVQVEPFSMIGISCRTNNAKEASGEGCIAEQWRRLFGEGILHKLPHHLDKIVAVYTDYASDKDGDYTYILGVWVRSATPAPDGMVKVNIGSGLFAVFTTDKGPAQQVVPATWKHIWETPKSQPGGDRAYEIDFEIYQDRDPNDVQVDIYIGIR